MKNLFNIKIIKIYKDIYKEANFPTLSEIRKTIFERK